MDKRIRIVWVLSIVTMLFIFMGQCYWLYSRYVLNTDEQIKKAIADCDEILKKEETIRFGIAKRKEAGEEKGGREDRLAEKVIERMKTENNEILHREIKISILSDSNDVQNMSSETKFYIAQDSGKMKPVKLEGVNAEDGVAVANRFLVSSKVKLSSEMLDSMFRSVGYDGIRDFTFFKSETCNVKPGYTVSGSFEKTVRVEYSTNPIMYEHIRFDIPIPVSMVISGMAWQLAASALMLVVLAFCLLYQMRIVIFQKRIDNLRREFMKNMIYEMKQPPAEEDSGQEEAMKIGNTDFYYSMNELRNGNERVIITGRQAELLRLLAASVNVMVPRETILKQIWGDDSYSNSLALNVQITYLRRALKSDRTLTIEAVIRKGYILKELSDDL
ncbi:MAG: winged helix-turn-helix domain-containing protein [Prevotella sp.]|uniref:winged helix-turn-helix domain-containing protein n=1 Tax=Prevotella sp. TaxID=59823 RepID=UPI002A26B3E3|nr:winged helix-turn-helix domain-containing protein [Prevotella sp.]MDD7318547.1 winged helix-turn-helix domain-containing protein [Prevotellaceae bacterium]MDY4020348.1 winged helix-turn-helix domain-containing protein [Prevotella sp.]